MKTLVILAFLAATILVVVEAHRSRPYWRKAAKWVRNERKNDKQDRPKNYERCNSKRCREIPYWCLDKTGEDKCCGQVCKGCLAVNGQVLKLGESLQVDCCTTCTCTRGRLGKQAKCERVECQPVPKFCYPFASVGTCCVECNACLLPNGELLNVGETVITPSCMTCTCEKGGENAACEPIVCDDCPAGYYPFVSINQCCPVCLPDDCQNAKCEECPPGYYPFASPDQCCPVCVPDDCQNAKCEECPPGYYPFAFPDQCCPACLPDDCSEAQCEECPPGYYPFVSADQCCPICIPPKKS